MVMLQDVAVIAVVAVVGVALRGCANAFFAHSHAVHERAMTTNVA
jgi:hypothetical protein